MKLLWIAASVVDAVAVHTNGIKTLLANALSSFPIKDTPIFNDGPNILPKTSPYCTTLCNWLFDSFLLAEELFTKALRSFVTCVLVNNNLCEKLFSSLESQIVCDERFKVTLVPSFIVDFKLLSCESASFTFNVLY